MDERLIVVGMGADGLDSLSPRGREAIAAARFIAGGRRHLECVNSTNARTFVISNNLNELRELLEALPSYEGCVVLASGDPLFYGIGKQLIGWLGSDRVEILPNLSSLQIAFARIGMAWSDVVTASVHSRPIAEVLLPLLNRDRIALLTRDGDSPASVALFLVERGFLEASVWVCEELGTERERVALYRLRELIGKRFADLNVMIIARDAGLGGLAPNLPAEVLLEDHWFDGPESGPRLLTHADVRALALSRFVAVPPGPIWDVGAGLGGMSITLARAFRERQIIAVEHSEAVLHFLISNRTRLGAFNLTIEAGEAPQALAGLPSPAAVFVGGTGGRLDSILDCCIPRLIDSGVIVANFVGLENLTRWLERFKSVGWETEVRQIQICRGQDLAGLTTFVPARPVWITRARRSKHNDKV